MKAIVPTRAEAAAWPAAELVVSTTAEPVSKAAMTSLEQTTAVSFATISCSFQPMTAGYSITSLRPR
jgi:hypothetical protein